MRSKLLLLAAVTLVGCSEDETTPPGTVEDAMAETFGLDARVDSTTPTDSGADTAMDSTVTDSGTDSSTDTGMLDTAMTDTRTDVAVDSATDSSATDSGADIAMDTAVADAIDSALDATDTAVTDAAFAAAPTCDGTIAAGEYGVHVEGSNQYSHTGGSTWYMTWDDTSLYLAVTNANVAEAVVVYIDANPVTGGTDADGNTAGYTYDATKLATLPFRANLVAYAKNSYREYRTSNGAGGWSMETTAFGCFAPTGTGTTRELSIPWSALGGRPASFGVLGYVTSGSGFVYGEIPMANPEGSIGTTATATKYFHVGATGPGATATAFATER